MNTRLRLAWILGASLTLHGLTSCAATPQPTEPAPAAETPEPVSLKVENSAKLRRNRRAPREGNEPPVDELLTQIGYLQGTEEAVTRPVITEHAPTKAMPGVNLVVSAHDAEATLMTRSGEVLHTWSRPFSEVWPGFEAKYRWETQTNWRRVLLLEDGHLIAIYGGVGTVRLDRDSNVVWATLNRAHHDLELYGDEVFTLTRTSRFMVEINERRPVFEDFVVVLDPETGREKRRLSIPEVMMASNPSDWKHAMNIADPFHANTITVLDGTGSDRLPALAEGNLMISMRHTSNMIIVDPETEKVLWSDRVKLRRQHDPHMLPNGNILYFKNNSRPPSAAAELDPVTHEEVWSYTGPSEAPLFSRTCGTTQHLDNGNIIAVESNHGRALEVTRDGELVWEYNNPHRVGDNREKVANLLQVERVSTESVSWLNEN